MARPPLELETYGTIRKRTVNGKGRADVYYRDASGVTRRLVRSGATEAAAERALKKALKETLAPRNEDLDAETTLHKTAIKWLEVFQAANSAVSTKNLYRGVVNGDLRRGIGSVRLREVTVPRLERMLATVIEESGPGRARTVRTVLNHVVSYAVRQGAMPHNLVKLTTPVPPTVKSVVAPEPRDVAKMRALMVAYDSGEHPNGLPRQTDMADVLDMLAGTGMRLGEILALQWSDIDLVASPATVTARATVSLDADGKIFIQEHGKTISSHRTLLLPAFTTKMLEKRRVESTGVLVFPSGTGTIRWPHNMRRQWRGALTGTEYKDVSPRDFRKAVATILKRQSGTEAARDQLGHSSDTVTRKHYIEILHMGPNATSILDNAFGKMDS